GVAGEVILELAHGSSTLSPTSQAKKLPQNGPELSQFCGVFGAKWNCPSLRSRFEIVSNALPPGVVACGPSMPIVRQLPPLMGGVSHAHAFREQVKKHRRPRAVWWTALGVAICQPFNDPRFENKLGPGPGC